MHEINTQADGKSEISVVLRCKNEEQFIGHSIQSLIDFIDNPEVIVINDRSTDDSMDIVRMFEHHVDIKKTVVEDYSPGKALNAGVKLAKHPYVLVISAHCVLTKLDLRKHLLDLESYCVVFGRQIACDRGRKTGCRYVWSNFVSERVVNMHSELEDRYFLHNGLALYKRQTLLDHPFDEVLYTKEDRYWINDMVKNENLKFVYDPSMECIHHWTPGGATWKGIG